MADISAQDLNFLIDAGRFLEKPGALIRIANTIGKPLELMNKALPVKAQEKLNSAVHKTLDQALKWSIETVQEQTRPLPPSLVLRRGRVSTVATTVTGAIGGFFGISALTIELPITTMIMLRSIADIAVQSGENIHLSETRLECIQILAMGSPRTSGDDQMESAYFTQRIAFARMLNKAAPAQLMARIAAEFKIVVTEKMILESLPVVGAIGGAVINAAFSNYFNKAAHYHFGIKTLERRYGAEQVSAAYTKLLK